MTSLLYYVVLLLLILTSRVQISGVSVPCSQAYYLKATYSGVISNYNYPFNYQDALNCAYYIYIDHDNIISDVTYDATPQIKYAKHGIDRSKGANNYLENVIPRAKSNDVTAYSVVCFRFARFDVESNHDIMKIEEKGVTFGYSGDGQGVATYNQTNRKHIWVDNFCFEPTNNVLKLTFTSDQSGSKPGFYATFWQQEKNSTTGLDTISTSGYHALDQEIIPNKTAPCFESSEWTCFNRGCISGHQKCDLSNSCGDSSDEMYIHAKCEIGDNGPSMHGCDFTHGQGCGLLGLATPGWYIDRYTDGPNMDPDRRPSMDHTVGHVSHNKEESAYVRTVFGDASQGYARLGLTDTSVTLDPNVTYCLSFWYHMTGPRVGRLCVSIQPELERPVWSRTANYSARWLHGQVLIDHLTGPGQVFFEGFRSHDYDTTFALDDISILQDVSCYSDDISCTFEFNFCGWTNIDAKFNRTLNKDPVTSNGGEYYLTFSGAPSSARIISPVWGSFVTGSDVYRACVQVWLYSSSVKYGKFIIWTVNVDGERGLVQELSPDVDSTPYVQHHWQEGSWKEFTIQVEASTPFKIEIEAVITGDAEFVELAVDEVVVIEDGCHLIELQPCPVDEFWCNPHDMCIMMERMCDGYNDCPDGADESNESCCYIGGCLFNQYCCDNRNCLWDSTEVCDGHNQCGDWSDETRCEGECGMFQCEEEESMCISADYKCDEHNDCPAGSDEKNCMAYLPPAAITSIIVVAVVIIVVVVVRTVICIKKKPNCSCRCRRGTDSDNSDTDITETPHLEDQGRYQQPPEYQECVNNPLYRKPGREDKTDEEPGAICPPSYDRVEKGEYKSLGVSDKVALRKLRQQIMAKSREAFNSSLDDSLSTIAMDVSVYAEISERQNEVDGESFTVVDVIQSRTGQRQAADDNIYSEITDMNSAPSGASMNSGDVQGVINQSFTPSVENVCAASSAASEVLSLATGTSAADISNMSPNSVLQHQFKRMNTSIERTEPVRHVTSVSRVGSNVSGGSIPMYSDLVHPPAYDNLSFCDGQSDVIHQPGTSLRLELARLARTYETQTTGQMSDASNSLVEHGEQTRCSPSQESSTDPSQHNSLSGRQESPSTFEECAGTRNEAAGVRLNQDADNREGDGNNEQSRGLKGKGKYKTGKVANSLYRHESDKLKSQIRQQMLKMKRARDGAGASSDNTKTVAPIIKSSTAPLDVRGEDTNHVYGCHVVEGRQRVVYTVQDDPSMSRAQSCTRLDSVPPTNSEPGHRHSVAAPDGTFSLPRGGVSSGLHRPLPSSSISRSMPCLVSGESAASGNYNTYQRNKLLLDPTRFTASGASSTRLDLIDSHPSVHQSTLQLGECSESSI